MLSLCLVLVFQLVSGGRLAHLEESGSASFCLGHHFTLDLNEELTHAENVLISDCGCQHDHHAPLVNDDSKSERIPHNHTECLRGVHDFTALAGLSIDLSADLLLTTPTPWPTLTAPLPSIAPLTVSARAPPRALVIPPPNAPPHWLLHCSLRN